MKTVALLVSVLLLPLACWAQDTSPQIEVTKISGNLYRLLVNEFVNIVALVGPDGVLLVDSGFAENAKQVQSALSRLGGDEIRFIVHTHADYDHVDGNSVLGENATILSHRNGRARLLALIDNRHPFFRDFPEQVVPSLTFDETVTIFVNSEELVLMPLVGGHTDTDVVVYFKKANVACLGDILIPDSFPVVKLDMGGNVETLIRNIEYLIRLFPDDVKLVVGHGRDAAMKDLEEYGKMLRETTGIITEAMKSGKDCEEIKREGLLGPWENWSGTVFEEIDSKMWIGTVCESSSK